MKVISGIYKGRILQGYNIDGTRPTMDRVKESLFAMIQEYIPNSVVLDLYSGTGNLAIESISNGASKAYLVDNNNIAIKTINNNLNMLNIDNVVVIKADATNTLKSIDKQIDIVFLDPPYKTNELNKSLQIINNNLDILTNKGIIVCETELKIDYSVYNNLNIIKQRKYGSKIITILTKCK